MSFIADKIVMDGLTYDDVLLIPAYSEVLPKTVELTTKLDVYKRQGVKVEIPKPSITNCPSTFLIFRMVYTFGYYYRIR